MFFDKGVRGVQIVWRRIFALGAIKKKNADKSVTSCTDDLLDVRKSKSGNLYSENSDFGGQMSFWQSTFGKIAFGQTIIGLKEIFF